MINAFFYVGLDWNFDHFCPFLVLEHYKDASLDLFKVFSEIKDAFPQKIICIICLHFIVYHQGFLLLLQSLYYHQTFHETPLVSHELWIQLVLSLNVLLSISMLQGDVRHLLCEDKDKKCHTYDHQKNLE